MTHQNQLLQVEFSCRRFVLHTSLIRSRPKTSASDLLVDPNPLVSPRMGNAAFYGSASQHEDDDELVPPAACSARTGSTSTRSRPNEKLLGTETRRRSHSSWVHLCFCSRGEIMSHLSGQMSRDVIKIHLQNNVVFI